jgi:RNA polymerase-binding transcription factor DksA
LGDIKLKCEKCGCTIPKARLSILPDTKFCVNCSDVKKNKGFCDGDSDLFIVEENLFKKFKKMQDSVK